MKPVELKNGLYWVGAIDWAVRDFHGYETPRGTTYNSYLIMDDEPTLVDTVKYDFADSLLKNIKGITEPRAIKNVIINHIENDHVTSIDRIMQLAPDATIYITERGKKGLSRFYYDMGNWKIKTVKTGDTLTIGKRSILFLETPMLHWPDSMVSYVPQDKVLFSQDAFGQHIASSARFDDDYITCTSHAELEDSVLDYYANILMPFGQLIKAKIAEIQKLGLQFDIIAPDHGIMWRADPGKIVQMYSDMADGKASLGVSIVYDTMWHSTEQMTQAIARGVKDSGVDCKVFKLRATPYSVVVKEFWRARATLIGSPTLNNVMFPTVSHFLTQLRGLRPKNRLVGGFGSFGWGGGAVKEIYEIVTKMGLEVFEAGPESLYRPSFEDEEKCYEFGAAFAEKAKEYHRKF